MAVKQVNYSDKDLKVRSLEILEGISGDAITEIVTKTETAQTIAIVSRAKLDGFIADIASDNRLTVVEKREIASRFSDIMIEKPRLVERAAGAGLDGSNSYVVSYEAAYSALYAFLYETPGPLLNMTSTTDVVGSTLVTLWTNYIESRESLLKARDAAVDAKVAQASRFFYGSDVPVGPYDVGDFWVVDDTIYISTVARGAGESDVNDWEWYIRPNLMTVIESTNGDVFKPGQTTVTTLIAHVFQNGLEITSSISETRFRWRRASFYPLTPPDDDATWNSNHTSGYKTIEVTAQDIYARATYFCDIME